MFERNHIVCVAEGSNCQVAGWGVIGKESKETSSTLLWAKVPIRSVTECRENYRFIDEKMHICAGDNKNYSCQVIIQPLNVFYL